MRDSLSLSLPFGLEAQRSYAVGFRRGDAEADDGERA